MYTEFAVHIELLKDTPEYVIDILKYMVDSEGEVSRIEANQIIGAEFTDEELFKCSRWEWLFIMDSYYFASETKYVLKFDKITSTWFLSGISNLKNYDDEIKKFLSWIEPYVRRRYGTYGHYRYEENLYPTLIVDDLFIGVTDPREIDYEVGKNAVFKYLDINKLTGTKVYDGDW